MKNIEYTALIYDGRRLVGYDLLTESFFFVDSDAQFVHLLQGHPSQNKNESFGGPCLDRGNIWFPPCCGPELVCISGDKISRYLIEYCKAQTYRFVNSFIEDNKVFLLPGCSKGIVVFDMENYKEKVIDDWWHQYEQYISPEKKNAKSYGKSRYGSYLKQGEYVYMPLVQAPVILKMNLHLYKTEILYFENQDSSGFLDIYEDINKYLFVTTRSSNEIVELRDDKIIHTYFVDMAGDTFGKSLYYEGRLYILGNEKGRLISFDLLTKNVCLYSLKPYFLPDENVEFHSFIRVGDHLLASDAKTGKCIGIYPGSNEIEVKDIEWNIDENNLQDILLEKIKAGRTVMENKVFTLERFLKIDYDTEKKKTDANIGAGIFKHLRELVQ